MKKILLILLACIGLVCWADTYERLTNLPHVYIDTYNKVGVTSKTTYVMGTMHMVDEQDSIIEYDSMEIRGRGNSTWSLSKKPYRIKFHEKEKLLGKGYAKARSWTLMANAADKTMMRNAITSMMGDFLGLKNNPAHKFVDLTLNGNYLGTYMISDQVEVRPHRVNIQEQDYPLADTSNITGGYLLEFDGFKDGNYWTTSKGAPIRIHYPDEDEIDARQTQYIKDYIGEVESRLFSNDFGNPETGYRTLMDTTSLCNWFLANEISANLDGYYSTYCYKEQDDSALYWGPLWDFDIAYNNDTRVTGTQQKMMVDDGFGSNVAKIWVKQFIQDRWFCDMVCRRYQQALDDGLEDFLFEHIDSVAHILNESQELNYAKWGISKRMYHEVVLYSTYQEYVDYLKSFLDTHLPYLTQALAEKQAAAIVWTPKEEETDTTEEEEKPEIAVLDTLHWYRIVNPASQKSWAINADSLVNLWTSSESDSTQLWRLRQVGDYYMLLNRWNEWALNDPTEGEPTATTLVGQQLNIAEADTTDSRQLWTLTPQDEGTLYNLTNLFSNHTANLSGGSQSDGSRIISYTNNERNATSSNRKWKFVEECIYEPPVIEPDTIAADTTVVDTTVVDTTVVDTTTVDPEPEPDPDPEVDPEPDGIESIEYALAWNPVTKTLHFGAEQPERMTFTASVYTTDGRKVRQFVANTQCQMSDLPHGLYIITWQIAGKQKSVKLKL